MSQKLYDLAALDMDGTLLNSDHVTTAFTREALSRADAAGKVVALCTGRCLSELDYHLKMLPGVRYAINESGGCIYDVRQDKILRRCAIDDDVAERLFDAAEQVDVLLQCFFGNRSYLQPQAPDRLGHWHMQDFAENFRTGSTFVQDARALWHDSGLPITKFILYFPDEAEMHRMDGVIGELDLYVTGCMGIGYELSPKDASKAMGLQALCRHLGIPMENTMAVGDGDNDVDLLRAAGLAVAMGNAVPTALQAADVLTDDCDHDGAARAVLKYMLGVDR